MAKGDPGQSQGAIRLACALLALACAALTAAVVLWGTGGQESPQGPPSAAAPPAPAPAAPGPGPAVRLIDLAAELETLARTRPDQPDIVRFYVQSEIASLHLHVLGRTQRAPMHLHRLGPEAVVILSGAPEVHHAYGAGRRSVRTLAPGDLVVSPASCGHEWRNPSPDAQQANLVFASPPFEGNLYVGEDDPRLQAGGPPEVLAVPDAPTPLAGIPPFGAQVQRLAADAPVDLPASVGTVLLLVVTGTGDLAADATHPLRPLTLAAIRPGTASRLVPAPGSRVGAYLFQPDLPRPANLQDPQ